MQKMINETLMKNKDLENEIEVIGNKGKHSYLVPCVSLLRLMNAIKPS
jgi:hypothetical protein